MEMAALPEVTAVIQTLLPRDHAHQEEALVAEAVAEEVAAVAEAAA